MMFNSILKFLQDKLNYFYNNSLILQNIDKIILPFILLTFISSMFMNSDYIGFIALIVMFLTFIKFIFCKGQKFELKAFELFLLIYFMIVIVSLFGSTLFSLSLKGFFKTFVYIGFYFSVSRYLKDNKNHIPLILGTIAGCITFEALIGIFQSTLHLEQISTWQDTSNLNPEDVISRVYGTLKPLNPNLYGGYLVCGLPVVIGSVFYFLYKKSYKLLLFSALSCLCVCYSILQTGCRGAYLSMILVFGLVFLLSAKFFWNTYKKIYISIISGATLLMIFALTFVNSLRLRFLSIFAMRNDSSNSFRFNVYHSSLEMFKDNWLLGIGVGNKNFREIYGLYMKTGFDALSAYNIYLETAVESGIFALISFVAFLGKLIYDAVKYVLTSKNIVNVIFVCACVISICSALFHGLVDTIYFRPQLQFIFWTFVAVIYSILSDNTDI